MKKKIKIKMQNLNDYSKFQKQYYEKEWSEIELSEKPEATGWRTRIPAPDFLKFVNWLKKNKITGNALDIGCGGGRHSIVLAKVGFVVYGIDLSKSAIKVAKENAKKSKVSSLIVFRTGDALRLPYKDNFLDIVNDDGCLHHISKYDWVKYIQQVTRVLKKNGILRVKAFSKNCIFYEKNKPKNSQSHWITADSHYTYFFDRNEIKNLFKTHFKMITLEEKYHPVTKEKKFFFIIARRK